MPSPPHRRLELTQLPDGRGDACERRVTGLLASSLQLLGAGPGDAMRLGAVLADWQGGGGGVDVTAGDG